MNLSIISNGYILSLGSVRQFVIAIFFLFAVTFLLIARRLKKNIKIENVNDKQSKGKQCALCKIIELLKAVGRLINRFFSRSAGKFTERIKKTCQYIISAYGDAIEDKAVIGLGVAICISIVFLLIVNSVWELLYDDVMFLTLDSRLSSGEAIELFVATVLSLLLAVMTWRLDSQIRHQDEKKHKEEEESQRKRELAGNELTATFCFSRINDKFNCTVLLKNKINATVFPAYLNVNKESMSAVFFDDENEQYNINEIYSSTEKICISFKNTDVNLSEEFLLKPICYETFSDKIYFKLEFDFKIYDNSVCDYNKDSIDVKSLHEFWISSPLRQISRDSYEFDCKVVSRLM